VANEIPVEIRRVAVIGAGPRGRRLAALFFAAGFETVLEDIMPSNLRKAAEQLQSAGLSGVRFASSVEDAVRDADLIVDCVPDELESKLEIFSLLDRMAPPRAILVTPTLNLSIADLASCTYRADRCVAVRFVDGNESSGKLEVVTTTRTLPPVLAAVHELWIRAGFTIASSSDPAEASVAAGTLF
jgi:3-hydroxybutyryl-CoA dehydrogenase